MNGSHGKPLRVTKPPEERREELLTAARLFAAQGFSKTAVSDIVKALGVAQGTFYYYFKSKEDVFLAIFGKRLEELAEKLRSLTRDGNLGAIQRLNALIAGLFAENMWERDPLLRELHNPENAGLHQKTLAKTAKALAPLFTTAIEQGIHEGVFKTRCPREAAEFVFGRRFVLARLTGLWLDQRGAGDQGGGASPHSRTDVGR